MSRDKNTKAFSQQKRHRRQWLTFVRMLRYGANNFTRNAWLTIAATAVMTITLVIVFVTVAAQNILSDTTVAIGKRIDRSIFLKSETTSEQAKPVMDRLSALSNVETVKFVSSVEGRALLAEDNKADNGTLAALNEATNQIPAKINITLRNVNDTSQLVTFVNKDEELKKLIDTNRQPTFMGERRAPTETIAQWTQFAQRAGVSASILFVAISALIVFNTIRMAIFNRKDEIEMMKLIGADKSFIRGPFIVEAIVYGFIAAVIATGLGILALILSADKLSAYGITIQPTIDYLTTFAVFVLLGMILLGSLVGTVSALFATRRYLKV